jgi:pimeloyl-ACP methyl ester carboxylesterase
LSTSHDLVPFAEHLAPRFSVHIIERRGRGESGAQGIGYSIAKESEDLLAVAADTDARLLVGHSYGGLIALETALLTDRFRKIAVYEPGVSIAGSIRGDWMPEYRNLLGAGKRADAFVAFVIGSRASGERTAPRWLMKPILAIAIPRVDRTRMYGLLEQNLREHEEVVRLDSTHFRYARIRAAVLLMYGETSGSKTAARTAGALASIIPATAARAFPGFDHFAIQKKGAFAIAAEVAHFFGD